MTVRVEVMTGESLLACLPELSLLRIEIFREFPYLYDGDLAYEQRYLAHYASAQDAVIVGAFDGRRLVGAATGAPLVEQEQQIWEPCKRLGYDLAHSFYFGESVLKPSYRGQGIGVQFFEQREAHARAVGASVALFSSVIRALNHQFRPVGYKPLDRFWRKRGYAVVDGLICSLSWKEIGEAKETMKPMQFWMKRLPL